MRLSLSSSASIRKLIVKVKAIRAYFNLTIEINPKSFETYREDIGPGDPGRICS